MTGEFMKTIVAPAFSAALLVAGFAVIPAEGQKTSPRTSPLVIESMYGPDLYRHYCATCHGGDGKGNGPAAAALKVPPPDLTLLARRRSGVFPVRDVEAIVRGGTRVTAHGSDVMPVWGPIFYALDPSDARAKARISSLVAHIESIQQK
jgi:mono/diheme cytochrome c family protein